MSGVGGLKILAFCDHFSPRSSGGAERVALEVYRRLVAQGAHVTVLSAASAGAAREGEIEGIRVRTVPALDLSGVTRAQVSLAPRAMTEAAALARDTRPDVLHANGLHFQSSVAAAVLQLRSRIPLVTTAHLARPEHLPTMTRVLTGAYEGSVGRFILARSVRVIGVSPSVARHTWSLGVSKERIHVIPNGVDHERFHPGEDRVPSQDRPLVLFVGRLIPNKGPQVLLEAIARLRPDADVVLLGEGPMREELRRRVEALGLGDRVRLEGHRSDVSVWFRRADVLVRPSFTEGLPLTVLEAMASGVCVVASDIGGNSDLVRDAESGVLFPVGDVAALMAGLRRVLEDDTERRRLADAGFEASRGYSWDACAEATGRVLVSAAVVR